MSLTPVTLPTDEEILALVSVQEVKENLRIRHSQEDDKVERAILDAYAFFGGPSGWLNRTVLTQQWLWKLPGFQTLKYGQGRDGTLTETWVTSNVIEIPKPPLQSVQSIRYYDTDGAAQTLYEPAGSPVATASDLLWEAAGGLFGEVRLRDGQSWPDTHVGNPGGVEIVFLAGYGDADDVKAQARGIARAIALLAGHYFLNPSDTIFADPRQVSQRIEFGMKQVAGQYRIWNTM